MIAAFFIEVVHLEEPMSLKQTLLNENKELKARVDALETRLHEIGDIAHDKSTGPAVNDCYWDIRELAYDLL